MSHVFAMSAPRSDYPLGIPSLSERRSMDLANIAKGVCSGIFVSKRALDDILETSVRAETEDGIAVRVDILADEQLVIAKLEDGTEEPMQRAARMVGDQGAVVLPVGTQKVFFMPQPITPQPQPGGWEAIDPSQDWDVAALTAAVDLAFAATPETYTAAFIVAHKGQIVAERYRDGVTVQTQLPSWSMGKTLTAILIGRLIYLGYLQLDQPAPIAQWQHDERKHITIRDLLQMSSGLDFTATWAQDYRPEMGYPDHSLIYGGAVDSYQLALSRPLVHPPGTLGAYKNGDTLALGALIKQACQDLGEPYFAWPQKVLFDPLGIDRFVLEPDPYGNLLLSGFNYGTPRHWLTLGQLLLQDGVWQGERLLPEGYVDFLRTPAEGWRGRYWMEDGPEGWTGSIYGGQLWLNRYPKADAWPLPEDACFMLGIGGQYTFFIPSLELVIVRMGHVRGLLETGAGREPLASALASLMAARKGAV
ncbi:MAG: serine hydrolase [Pseudomonadota bacterium]